MHFNLTTITPFVCRLQSKLSLVITISSIVISVNNTRYIKYIQLLTQNQSQIGVCGFGVANGSPVLQGCFYRAQEQLRPDVLSDVSNDFYWIRTQACGLQTQCFNHTHIKLCIEVLQSFTAIYQQLLVVSDWLNLYSPRRLQTISTKYC